LFSLLPPIAPHAHRQLPAPGTPKPARSSYAANPHRCIPAMTCCGSRRPRAERIRSRARPDSTERCGRAVTSVIDQGADTATSLRPIASGRRQSDAGRGIGSDPTLNAEGGVRRNEILNVEAEVGRECRVINRRAEGWRSGLKGRTTSAKERERRPDEPGKAP
jgi:hypothetical protein